MFHGVGAFSLKGHVENDADELRGFDWWSNKAYGNKNGVMSLSVVCSPKLEPLTKFAQQPRVCIPYITLW